MNKTNLIIVICILAFALSWFWESDLIVEYLAFSGNNLLSFRIWTLITALFLHADIFHLAGNMLFLFVFGNTLENEVGADKTLGVFFLGGVLSFILGMLFYDPSIIIIGASAAIFTLTSIIMLVKPLKFSFLFLMPQGLVAVIYFMYNVFAIYYGAQGNIAYVSHVIGFTIGIPFGIAWSKEWAKNLLIAIGLSLIYLFIVLFLLPGILEI